MWPAKSITIFRGFLRLQSKWWTSTEIPSFCCNPPTVTSKFPPKRNRPMITLSSNCNPSNLKFGILYICSTYCFAVYPKSPLPATLPFSPPHNYFMFRRCHHAQESWEPVHIISWWKCTVKQPSVVTPLLRSLRYRQYALTCLKA